MKKRGTEKMNGDLFFFFTNSVLFATINHIVQKKEHIV